MSSFAPIQILSNLEHSSPAHSSLSRNSGGIPAEHAAFSSTSSSIHQLLKLSHRYYCPRNSMQTAVFQAQELDPK